MKQLVLVGAGHAHARVLLDFARRASTGTALTLVTPAPLAPYSGMVPGWMAGHYEWDACCIDFAHLCRLAGATLHIGMANRIDAPASILHLESGEQLAYDALSLDIGSRAAAPGGADMLLPMRPLARLRERWECLQDHVSALPAGASCRVLVVGGGAAGAESMLAARRQLAQWAPHVAFDYVLATQGEQLLPSLAQSAAKKVGAHFSRHAIGVVHGFEAARITKAGVDSCDGAMLTADVVLWAAGARAHAWPATSGIALDGDGFVKVDAHLRSVSHPNIFAAGDCASFRDAVPKAGVFAVRMGPVLAHNVRALLEGRPMKKFAAQRRYLVLLGTGDEHAVAAWGPFSWQGRWVWRWKRRIDLRFLAQYNSATTVRLNPFSFPPF